MKIKQWYQSRTIWLNFISILAIVLQYMVGRAFINTEIQVLIISVANILVRLDTNTEIEA